MFIENLSYDQVGVYISRSRVATVPGFGTKEVNICRFVGRTMEIEVRPLAGQPFHVQYDGTQPFARGDHIWLQVGVRTWQSFAIPREQD
jgi:hypothetical protein